MRDEGAGHMGGWCTHNPLHDLSSELVVVAEHSRQADAQAKRKLEVCLLRGDCRGGTAWETRDES